MNLKEFYRNRKVLVTGHTGFKGSWLCSILLELEANVCGIGLEPNTNPSLFNQLNLGDRIQNHNITDIRDLASLVKIFNEFKPEVVIHMAAQPLVLESYNNPVYTYDVNVMGTVNICECVRLASSVKSFVNVTTDKVYENKEQERYAYVETDRLNGFDPYSNSKSCSELITDSYNKSFFVGKDIAVSTCRAGNVIGGGDYADNRIIPDCIRAAKKGETIILRNPNSIRPYQHVLEADVFYLNLAMQQYDNLNKAGSYNIGPNKDDIKSTKDISEMFCQCWGEDSKWRSISKESASKAHEAQYLQLDNSKSKEVLNWKPKLNLSDAVRMVVDWEKSDDKIIETSDCICKYIGGEQDE